MKEYVCGFLFDESMASVALIEKQKPEWQRGKWNGIGGKIEPGETPHDAMYREFREEAGMNVMNWENFCVLSGEDWRVHFLCARSKRVFDVATVTEERVFVYCVNYLPDVIPNLRWLIPMAVSFQRGERRISFRIQEMAA